MNIKYSKKIFFACLMLISNVLILSAQITGSLALNNRPPSYLSDWNNAYTGQLLLNLNGAGNNLEIKLATKILDESGNTIAFSNNNQAVIITLNQGANIVNINRVLQLENLQFTESNSNESSLARTGKLLPGNYQLYVQALSMDNMPLEFEQTKPFQQIKFQLPYLLSPANKSCLHADVAQTAIIFRWSNLLPVSQATPVYRLQVYEVLDHQTPMQALRANQPILFTSVNRVTQFIWRPQMPFKDSTIHTFIWTVQSLDEKGIPITTQDANNQGTSEPSLFKVCDFKPNAKITHDCWKESN
jgi:hypothetical protein